MLGIKVENIGRCINSQQHHNNVFFISHPRDEFIISKRSHTLNVDMNLQREEIENPLDFLFLSNILNL